MRLLAPLSIYAALLTGLISSMAAQAAPMFARQYGVSCMTCHAAFPRLNAYGEEFAANNFRMPNWKDTTVQTGDDQLALPSQIPMAVRAQAFTQARSAERIDVETGDRVQADGDFQAPYLIKLLSSAPLSEHISYYFYGIMAEKGGNGETIIEDAWFSHDDVFGTGTGMMLGQFQVSDLMFPRETRLTFQDYMAYRLAGITYERGVVFDHGFGGVDIAVGVVNGNGIKENLTINSPGYQRPDHLFDNDNKKSVFMRLGTDIGPVSTGLFAYAGEQRNATNPAGGDIEPERYTDKRIAGLDLSGQIGGNTYWFAQILMNQWDDFINQGSDYDWLAGFIGVDYITGNRWTYSLLYNYAEADDFKNSDTVYEGIEMNSLSLNASYYFMRNLKGVIEINYDLLDEEQKTGAFWTGHLSSEDYILFGFDAAF